MWTSPDYGVTCVNGKIRVSFAPLNEEETCTNWLGLELDQRLDVNGNYIFASSF